jgi:hypothetical protein
MRRVLVVGGAGVFGSRLMPCQANAGIAQAAAGCENAYLIRLRLLR